MIKAISAEVHTMKKAQQEETNSMKLSIQKLNGKVDAYEVNSLGLAKRVQEQLQINTDLIMTEVVTTYDHTCKESEMRLEHKIQSLEQSVTSLSNLSDRTEKGTTELAQKLERAVFDFSTYTAATTLTMQVLEQNLQTYRTDTNNILKSLVTRVNEIPLSDNFRSIERQMTDFQQTQTQLAHQLLAQGATFKEAVAQNAVTQTQQTYIMTKPGQLEDQNEGIQKMLSKISRAHLKNAQTNKPTSRTAIEAYNAKKQQQKTTETETSDLSMDGDAEQLPLLTQGHRTMQKISITQSSSYPPSQNPMSSEGATK